MTHDLDIPISRGTGWWREEMQLEAGKQPHHFEIARKLRDPHATPIPQIVRDHIAGLLDGTIKKRRGAPPPSQSEYGEKVLLSYLLRKKHAELMDQLKEDGADNRYQNALGDLQAELAAHGIDIKDGTLEDWMNWARQNNSPI
jgi:hypothetical protein